ncbi:MAG: hypothetical protein V4736_16005 [Bdellovibrionota bacterium]
MVRHLFALLILATFSKAHALELVPFEDAATCSAGRLLIEPTLTKVPDTFRLPRTEEATLPKQCVNYILREGGFTFAKCETRSSQPTYYGMGTDFKACVTPDYFHTVYNTYTDIMDCLDLDPKLLLPKLYIESGLHINSFNRFGFDSGIGQLTTPAIADVLADGFDIRTKRVIDSPKESCKRVAAIPGIFNVVPADKAHRCEFIDAGINPARNILFTGFYVQVLRKRVKYHMKQSEIQAKLNEAGITNATEDHLASIMAILGYNVGPSTAVSYLEAYLDSRIAKIKSAQAGVVLDTDFDANLNLDEDMLIFKDVSSHANADKEYGGNLLEKMGIQNISFPRFMIMVQEVGGRGYLTHLARMKKKLDDNTEKNACTTSDFLKL